MASAALNEYERAPPQQSEEVQTQKKTLENNEDSKNLVVHVMCDSM